MYKAISCIAALLLIAASVSAQKGAPIIVKPGEVKQVKWLTSPRPADVLLCCGGALQLVWSRMDGSGVDRSVVVNDDNSCPNTLLNPEHAQVVAQGAPKGLVTLDFKQNGDYYVSSSVAQHCSQQGMQFLMAVRGCPTDDPTYTAAVNIGWQQFCMSQNATMGPMGAMGMNGTMGVGLPGTEPLANGRARQTNSGSSSSGSSRMAVAVAAAALAVAAAVGL